MSSPTERCDPAALALEESEQLMTRIQRDVADSWHGGQVSVVDELLAERRLEAAAEDRNR